MFDGLSLIIPTYNEAKNIPLLIKQIYEVFKNNNLIGEIIIVDDDSPDKTWTIAESIAKKINDEKIQIKVLRRKGEKGLSSAVIDGISISKFDIIGIMDADLSHPPQKIIDLLKPIIEGEAEITIGSRYIKGGKIENWPLKRKLMSRIACLFALPITKIKDPMSGFIMFKKSVIDEVTLNPIGFKIGLEIIAKGKYNNIIEIPITFKDRKYGTSKLKACTVFNYFEQIIKLYLLNQFLKFCIVGSTGIIVNMLIYSFLIFLGIHYIAAATFSFIGALTSNFFFNKIWTFKNFSFNIQTVIRQYIKFAFVCLGGYIINICVLYSLYNYLNFNKIIAQFIGILVATIGNFLGSKKWAFAL